MKNTLDIDGIVANLLAEKFSAEDQEYISKLTPKALSLLHHGVGTSIRNEYGLWSDSPLTRNWRENEAGRDIRDGVDYSADHPDSVSMIILEKVWERLQPTLKPAV